MNNLEYFRDQAGAYAEEADTLRDQRDDALALVRDLQEQVAELKREISLRDHVIRTCAEMLEGLEYPRTSKWLRDFLTHEEESGKVGVDSGGG